MTMITMYLLVFLTASSQSNGIITIMLLEVLSWIILTAMVMDVGFSYLIIQSYFLLGALLSLMMNSIPILTVMLLYKLGIPPFHWWMIRILYSLKKVLFWFMSSIHKVAPILVLVLLSIKGLEIILIMLVASLIMMSEATSFFVIFVMSSMMHTGWILYSSVSSTILPTKYMVLYFMVLYVFIMILISEWLQFSGQNSSSMMVWILLMGIPPFMVFWLKVSVMSSTMMIMTNISMILMLVMIMSIVAYYRVFSLLISLSMSNNYFMWAMLMSLLFIVC